MTGVEHSPSEQVSRLPSSVPEWLWYAAMLLFFFVCAIPNLIFPFVADQVVALEGARVLARGGVLYVDFWDNKMPGLLWFYHAAGALFGYDEIGIHTLELIWMSAFAVLMMLGLRPYLRPAWLSALAPIAVLGVYYTGAEAFLLTQLEILSALPTFAALLCVAALAGDPPHPRRLGVASGVFAGIAVVFKLVLAPLFVAFWLVLSIDLLCRRGARPGAILMTVWIPAAVGTGIVLGAVIVKFWADGALDELLWTAFSYPPQALAMTPPAPYYRLAESTRFFVTYFLPWSGFIAAAVYYWWRFDRDIVTSLLIAWLGAGIVVILIQRFSWWPYHFLLLFTPAGLLGVRGLGHFVCFVSAHTNYVRATSATFTPFMARAMIILPLLGAVAIPGGQKITAVLTVFVEKDGSLFDFHKGINTNYAKIRRSTRFLVDPAALPGKIYVFGNPLNYHLSGREPALPIIGWPWEFFLRSQWDRLPQQLDAASPPYIYINKLNALMMEQRGGGVKALIDERYIELFADHEGHWYIQKPKYRRR